MDVVHVFLRPVADASPHDTAWALLADAMDAMGDAIATYTLCRTPLGKPYFSEEGAPHFSLSHTKALAVCALAHTPIGIDTEPQDRVVSPAVARRFLCGAPPSEALLAWTKRESYGKLTGEGVAVQSPFDPSRYRFTVYTAEEHLITLCHPCDTASSPTITRISHTHI